MKDTTRELMVCPDCNASRRIDTDGGRIVRYKRTAPACKACRRWLRGKSITAMSREQVKGLIAELETCQNGFHRLNGASVRVRNMRIQAKTVRADIILCSSEDGPDERYNDCRYPVPVLMKVQQDLEAWEMRRAGVRSPEEGTP
jgi:hypothetical protein